MEKAANEAKDEVASARMEDLKTFVSLEAELDIKSFPNKDPEKGLFMESLATKAPRVSGVVKAWLDSATEEEFNQSIYFAEGFLRCRYQREALQKPLAELDDSLIDESSDVELLQVGC